jgi:hypothetical protein
LISVGYAIERTSSWREVVTVRSESIAEFRDRLIEEIRDT